MITDWFVGFVGDSEDRPRQWFDIFTCNKFRHCLLLGFDPVSCVWVYIDPTTDGTKVMTFQAGSMTVGGIISYVQERGCWLRVKAGEHKFLTGCWRLYCVPIVKSFAGIRSCALRPKGLYRDLVRAGATPAFVKEDDHGKPIQETEAKKNAQGRSSGTAEAS